MFVIDHDRLRRRDPRELRKLRRFLLGIRRGEVNHLKVMHEHDDRCCRKEPWPVTLSTLTRAMMPDTKTAVVTLKPSEVSP
jgi:hypothetical protein